MITWALEVGLARAPGGDRGRVWKEVAAMGESPRWDASLPCGPQRRGSRWLTELEESSEPEGNLRGAWKTPSRAEGPGEALGLGRTDKGAEAPKGWNWDGLASGGGGGWSGARGRARAERASAHSRAAAGGKREAGEPLPPF